MIRLAGVCVAMLTVVLPACYAQIAEPAGKGTRPELTQRELVGYVREQLVALSPSDGINDNVKVSFAQATSVLSIFLPNGRCDIYLKALDTDSAAWELFDPSEPGQTREQLLRLTFNAENGKKARTCYDSHHSVDTSFSQDHVRFLFSQTKANAVPNFSEAMENAIKKLVALARAEQRPPLL